MGAHQPRDRRHSAAGTRARSALALRNEHETIFFQHHPKNSSTDERLTDVTTDRSMLGSTGRGNTSCPRNRTRSTQHSVTCHTNLLPTGRDSPGLDPRGDTDTCARIPDRDGRVYVDADGFGETLAPLPATDCFGDSGGVGARVVASPGTREDDAMKRWTYHESAQGWKDAWADLWQSIWHVYEPYLRRLSDWLRR